MSYKCPNKYNGIRSLYPHDRGYGYNFFRKLMFWEKSIKLEAPELICFSCKKKLLANPVFRWGRQVSHSVIRVQVVTARSKVRRWRLRSL